MFFGDRPLLRQLFNAADEDVEFTLPESEAVQWHLALDTALDEAKAERTVRRPAGDRTSLRPGRSPRFNGLTA